METLRRKIGERSQKIFTALQSKFYRETHYIFIILFVLQWVGAIITAYVVSPRAWSGLESSLHPHVFAAAFLGGLISLFPIFLIFFYPIHSLTRYIVAIAQILWSSILIHLTGGRIETHFHVFGSLAFLSFYRDWKVLAIPTLIVAADHYFRGIYWPQSVFGITTPEAWRWIEHGCWVVFENSFLVMACIIGLREARAISDRTAQLEFTNETIETKVRIRTKELEVSQKKLEEASKAKDTFLANMSHEIRTPLNGIIGMSSILNETPLDAKQKRYVDVIIDSGKVLLNVITDILEFSRIQAGKLELHDSLFNMEALISEVTSVVSFAANEKKLKLTSSVQENIPKFLFGDAFRLKQVLINLSNNAIKFTEKGEVRISVEYDGEKKNSNECCPLKITVSDTGIGIPQERIQELFKPFTQLDNSSTRKYGGSGLGLSIVSNIVALMKGTIEVQSTIGIGSQFAVRIELKKHEDNAITTKKSEDQKTKNVIGTTTTTPLKALIVEDNPSNQLVIEELLSALGYTFSTASNGLEALEKLEKEPVDVCLMDIQMPVMDGIETTRRIRNSDHKDLPIIALSASVFESQKAACFEAGIDDFLEKPVRIDRLRGILEKWIHER